MLYKFSKDYQRTIMDVKTISGLWGVVKTTIVQKWDPILIRNHSMKKLLSHWCHTELEIINELIYSQRKSVTENFAIW